MVMVIGVRVRSPRRTLANHGFLHSLIFGGGAIDVNHCSGDRFGATIRQQCGDMMWGERMGAD